MIRIRTNTANIRASIKALKASAPVATEDGVVVMAAAALRRAGMRGTTRFTKGTHRFARGFLMAHNAITVGRSHLAPLGVTPVPLPRLRRSVMVDKAFASLTERARRGHAYLRSLEQTRRDMTRGVHSDSGLKRPGLVKINREIQRVQEYLTRADNEIQRFESALTRRGALVMFGRSTKTAFRLSNIERIFPDEFGASARVLRTGDRTTVEFSHHEPHSRIVEGRSRLWGTALADIRHETGGFASTGSGKAAAAFFGRIGKGLAPGTRIVRGSGGALFARGGR